METVPGTSVVVTNNVGGTLLGFLTQALSWLAFGFFVCGGWRLMDWLIAKV